MVMPNKAKRPRRLAPRSCLGPVADLEAHLPEEWWRKLFNALYVKTDGDVVENLENTRREVDFIVSSAAIQPHSHILDLCCGQGRHCLELARRGFKHVMGLDRSRYLVRLAKKRAQTEGLQVLFKEGDARNPRLPENSIDCVAIMGNSFGYFSNKQDDEKVLTAVGKILRPSGQLVLDITDGGHMHENFDKRSWEWIDEHHFVCRERSISQDGERLISREVIVHDEMGVIADQFYAERLYTRESIGKLMEKTGFRNVRHHGHAEALSDRDQDLGMMARRILLSRRCPASAGPQGQRQAAGARRDGADGRPPTARPGQARRHLQSRGHRDHPQAQGRAGRAAELQVPLPRQSRHAGARPGRAAHRPGVQPLRRGLEQRSLQGAARARRCWRCWASATPARARPRSPPATTRAWCARWRMALDVPVPLESYVRPGDQGATLPSVFPALLKPNQGDSSQGITKDSVVTNEKALLDSLDRLRAEFPKRGVLVQEFLTGAEYSVGLVGNPDQGLRALPILEVDYSRLDPKLPKILGYESKWVPDSPYWTQIKYREATLADQKQQQMIDSSSRLFERLGCRDYARFDFRADARGEIKLLEVNPNPGWCWDGKMNIMAGFQGMRYSELLGQILQAAVERVGVTAKPAQAAANGNGHAHAVAAE